MLKAQKTIYYWHIPNRDYYTGIQTTPLTVPYTPERQGEAVAFSADGSGYYTLSEGSNATLYYYKRVVEPTVDNTNK